MGKNLRLLILFLLFALSGMTLAAGIAMAGEKDRLPRVVSLDSCADQFVLALAKPEQILALSPNATLPFSYFRERAADFPSHNGSAEEILMLRPDVVVRTAQGDFALAQMLERQGIRTFATGLPAGFSEMRNDIMVFGEALGQPEAAKILVEEMDRRLARIDPISEADGPAAIYISPGGATSGPGTFLDEVLRMSGLRNQMADLGMEGWGTIELEFLVIDPPEVIIGSFFDARTGASDSWRLGDHPVAKKIFSEAQFIEVPSRLLSCPAWYALDAVDLIRQTLIQEALQ